MVKRIVWAILLVMSILLVWVGLAQQPATPVHQTTKHLAQGQASQMPLYKSACELIWRGILSYGLAFNG